MTSHPYTLGIVAAIIPIFATMVWNGQQPTIRGSENERFGNSNSEHSKERDASALSSIKAELLKNAKNRENGALSSICAVLRSDPRWLSIYLKEIPQQHQDNLITSILSFLAYNDPPTFWNLLTIEGPANQRLRSPEYLTSPGALVSIRYAVSGAPQRASTFLLHSNPNSGLVDTITHELSRNSYGARSLIEVWPDLPVDSLSDQVLYQLAKQVLGNEDIISIDRLAASQVGLLNAAFASHQRINDLYAGKMTEGNEALIRSLEPGMQSGAATGFAWSDEPLSINLYTDLISANRIPISVVADLIQGGHDDLALGILDRGITMGMNEPQVSEIRLEIAVNLANYGGKYEQAIKILEGDTSPTARETLLKLERDWQLYDPDRAKSQ